MIHDARTRERLVWTRRALQEAGRFFASRNDRIDFGKMLRGVGIVVLLLAGGAGADPKYPEGSGNAARRSAVNFNCPDFGLASPYFSLASACFCSAFASAQNFFHSAGMSSPSRAAAYQALCFQ